MILNAFILFSVGIFNDDSFTVVAVAVASGQKLLNDGRVSCRCCNAFIHCQFMSIYNIINRKQHKYPNKM